MYRIVSPLGALKAIKENETSIVEVDIKCNVERTNLSDKYYYVLPTPDIM